MNNNKSPLSGEVIATPYSHAGGSLSLSGPALVGLIQEILARGLPFRFSAPGTSMSPFIRDGDVITITPYQSALCRPGVVVGFVSPNTGRLVVHRVVAVSKNGCRIRGDNSPEEDGEIPHAFIIGKVIRVERAGKIIRFGLGPERRIIALLSLWRLLPFLIGAAGPFCSVLRRFS